MADAVREHAGADGAGAEPDGAGAVPAGRERLGTADRGRLDAAARELDALARLGELHRARPPRRPGGRRAGAGARGSDARRVGPPAPAVSR